jgi:hypothetical protein
MLILIMCGYDGDSYRLSNNLDLLENKFQEAKESQLFHRIVLVDVELDQEIGFGAEGEFFGGKVIKDWDELSDDDFIDPAGGRGLHSHI